MSLVADVGILGLSRLFVGMVSASYLLAHADRHVLISWPPEDRRKYYTRGVVSGEASLARAGPVVDDPQNNGYTLYGKKNKPQHQRRRTCRPTPDPMVSLATPLMRQHTEMLAAQWIEAYYSRRGFSSDFNDLLLYQWTFLRTGRTC